MAEQTTEKTKNQARAERDLYAIRMMSLGHGLMKVAWELRLYAAERGPNPMSTDATRAILRQHLLNAAADPDFEEVLHAVSAHLSDMAKGLTTDTLKQAAQKAKETDA